MRGTHTVDENGKRNKIQINLKLKGLAALYLHFPVSKLRACENGLSPLSTWVALATPGSAGDAASVTLSGERSYDPEGADVDDSHGAGASHCDNRYGELGRGCGEGRRECEASCPLHCAGSCVPAAVGVAVQRFNASAALSVDHDGTIVSNPVDTTAHLRWPEMLLLWRTSLNQGHTLKRSSWRTTAVV